MWSDETIEAWVKECLFSINSTLTPTLKTRLERHLDKKGQKNGVLFNFTRAAQPVAHLPIWVAESMTQMGKPPLEKNVKNAVWSAISGYLYAQIQDGIVDSDSVTDPEGMILANQLFLHHQHCLFPALAYDNAFRTRWFSLWQGYGKALSLERHLSRGNGVETWGNFQDVLKRSHPMLIPGASLLALGDQMDHMRDLEVIISLTTLAAQLADDAVDALTDLKEGNFTWVVCTHGGHKGTHELIQNLYLGGGFEQVIAEASTYLEQAINIAHAQNFSPIGLAFSQHRERLNGLTEEIHRQILNSAISKPKEAEHNTKPKQHTEKGDFNHPIQTNF